MGRAFLQEGYRSPAPSFTRAVSCACSRELRYRPHLVCLVEDVAFVLTRALLMLLSPPSLSFSPLVPLSAVVLLRSSLTGGPVGSLRLGCRTCDCASPGNSFADEGEEALRGGAVPRVHLAYLRSLLHWPDRCTESVGVTGRWRLGDAAMGWAQFISCDELSSSPSCAPASRSALISTSQPFMVGRYRRCTISWSTPFH